MIKVSYIVLFSIFILRVSAQPIITSFSPSSGPVGTEVSILGSGFDSNPESNIVFFGGTQAVVLSAASSELKVIVPAGATYHPISVLVNGLIGYSSSPFHIAFGGSGMDMNSFGPKQDFSQPGGADQIVVADLDGDGRNDLLVLRTGRLSVFQNVGATSESIGFEIKQDMFTGPSLRSVVVGELDGDGKPDLVVTSLNGFMISIFRNTSEGGTISFGPQRDFVAGQPGADLSLGDIDGDGKTDIAMYTREISVFRNTSEGIGHISLAAPVTFNPGKALLSLLLTDLNNDGKPDFLGLYSYAFGGGLYSSGVVGINNTGSPGTMSFAQPVTFSNSGDLRAMTLGDLDKDDKPDVVLTFVNFSDNLFNAAYFYTMNNTSTSSEISFGSPKKITTQNAYHLGQVSTRDLDGDGAMDLIICHTEYFVLYRNLLLESGAVDFAYEATFAAAPRQLEKGTIHSAGDLDNDGKVDILTSTKYADYISVFRNKIVSRSNDVLSFNLSGQVKSTEINKSDHTITIKMPVGTDLKSLVPAFSLPYGATAKVGGIAQESEVTSNNFTNSVTYTVTAEDGVATQDWIVNVSQEIGTALDPERNGYTLYPNPVYHGFTLMGINDNTYINIVDLYGRPCRFQRTNNSGYIDVGDLPEGIYLVIVKGDEGEQKIKVVKK